MKQKANLLTKAGVLLLAVVMLFSTLPAMSAETEISTAENDDLGISNPDGATFYPRLESIRLDVGEPLGAPGAEGDLLFMQPVDADSASWSMASIDESGGYGMFENFQLSADESIGKVAVAGLNLRHDGSSWVTVDPLTVQFHVEFYDDAYSPQGMPTTPIAGSYFTITSYESVTALPGSYSGYTCYEWVFDLPSDVDVTGQEGWMYLGAINGGCLWGSSHSGDLFSYQVGAAPPETIYDRAMTLYEGAGGGPGPGPGGEECIPDACDFAMFGFSPEFDAMSNYDEILETYYWNSLPKTLTFSVANKGEIGISEVKILVDIYEKICGPTTEIFCDEKYDIQLFEICPPYPYMFEDWYITDDLDGDSWVLQGGPDNRWLTNNQAWRSTAGEDRSFGDDADVYLGKNDNPLAAGITDDLITPGFDIAGAACVDFSFSHWAEGEYTTNDDGYIVPVDFGTIAYSLNGGVNWTEIGINDFLAYDTFDEWVDVSIKFINTCIDADDDDYMHPYATVCDDCAPEEGDILIEECFPLDAELMVKFMWDKDPCLQFEGWYIDNVCVTRTEDYALELVYQGHIIMELLPCEDNVTWIDIDFPIDWDPQPDTWYELWAHGQVFSPVGCEIDLLNNWFKTQFKIVDIHDMACIGMELISPEDGTGTPGDSVVVNVTVKNLGSFTESNVPVDLYVGDMVVDEVINTDFETDPAGLFTAYYFIGGSGDVPFRWTAGDGSIDNIYTNDPAQARSKKPGFESYICAEEGTMPYLMEDTACYLEISETFDLDRNDNGVQDFGDPAAATFNFDAKWSMELGGSYACIGVSIAEGPASGYVKFEDFGIQGDPDGYENDWQHIDIDLFDFIDGVLDYWESSYGFVYDDIPPFNMGYCVFADGIGFQIYDGSEVNGGVSNIYNPVPWSGLMLDRVQLNIIEVADGTLEKVSTGATGSLAPGAEETLQLTWGDAVLCHHALVADVNADDDINPNNDKCFETVRILDEEKCFTGGSVDLTTGMDCLWHVCTNRENGDDYFAWTGITEEHWAHYVNNMDDSIISPTFNITGFTDEGVMLNFTTYYELQPGDFGEVYVQSGGEWHLLKKFMGSSGSGFKDVGLFVKEEWCSDFMKFKFRFVSNDEGVSEGWFFDDLYIIDVTDDGSLATLADSWVGYSSLYTDNSVSWGDPMIIGIELTAAELTGLYGQDITELLVSIGCDVYGFEASPYEIFMDTAYPAIPLTGTPVATGTGNAGGWTSITFPTPWATPASGSVFVIVSFTAYIDFPAGLDMSITTPPRGGLIVDPNYNTWTDIGAAGLPGVWGIDVGFTAGGGSGTYVFGDIIPAIMWLDPEGDNAMPHGLVEDFERGTIDPWICDPGIGGNYWKKSTDNTTLPNADAGIDGNDECEDPCIDGWYVIEGYTGSGTALNNAQWFEIDLSDPQLIYAKLEFYMDYDLADETIYVEFSPDWEPGTDMNDATWTAYFIHTPGDNYGDNTGGWVLIDDVVGDDRFVIDEYLGNTVYVRFRLTTPGNGATVGAGWAIDGLALVVKRLDAPIITDNEAPVTSIFFDADSGMVTLVAVDYPLNKGSGVATTKYTLDGVEKTYTGPFNIGEGSHTVQYWSIDNVGNIEGKNTATYVVDTTKPTVEITSPEPGIYFLGNKLLSFGSKAICIGKVPIAADADDGTGSGIARVLFDVNGDTGYDSTAPYEYVFRGMNFGSLAISATAIDNKGLASTPDEITVTCFSLGLL